MISSPYKQAALVFAGLPGESHSHELNISPIKGGLINHSFLVRPPSGTAFILQQINKTVFKNPIDVQENYLTIWKNRQSLILPTPIFYETDKCLFNDSAGQFWRAFEFIENSVSHSLASKPSQAFATAKAFGSFTATFTSFNADQLIDTIPDFHNLKLRFDQFTAAYADSSRELISKAGNTLQQLIDRSNYKDFYERVVSDPINFPKRVMHHDAKIANVLFDKNSGEVICLVDFDTVMPGYFFSDLGDMIRSMTCSHDENYHGTDEIKIRPDFYEAIAEGYLTVMRGQLTPKEIEYIHYGGLIMIYMQALRFMSDFLQNDIYYQIEYAGQNLSRAKNQLELLISLESFLKKYQVKKESSLLPEK